MNRLISKLLICTVLSAAFFGLAAGQSVWEKRLAPGLLYRQEVDSKIPLVVNALRFSPGTPALKLVAALAKDHVFDATPDKGRETVSSLVQRKSAIAGINGDFFQVPYTGDPLGVMVMDSVLISNPIYPRSAFGWGDSTWLIGLPIWKGSIAVGASTPNELDGINEAVGIDRVDLLLPECGTYTAKTPNVTVYAKLVGGKAQPSSAMEFEITKVASDVVSGQVDEGGIIVATGVRASLLASAKEGDHIKVNLGVEGFDWSKISNSISGGPRLMRDGKVEVTSDAEKFRDSFTNKRHPRSAVGITSSGELWFVTVDGRQKHTDGATLQELAEIMKRFGCVDAMNFDGGGSSDLATKYGPLNRPSDGAERPIANAMLFVETPGAVHEKKYAHTLAMRFPARLDLKGKFNLSLTEHGIKVPNSEIMWMSAGDGWVDQGGTVRALDAGSVRVIAVARGTKVETVIPIGGADAKPTAATSKAPLKAPAQKKPALPASSDD